MLLMVIFLSVCVLDLRLCLFYFQAALDLFYHRIKFNSKHNELRLTSVICAEHRTVVFHTVNDLTRYLLV